MSKKDKNLAIFNEEIIPVYTTDTGEKIVIGRELYERLNLDTPYTQWFERMCAYGFIENQDYSGFSQKSEKPLGGRPTQEHYLKLDMAKHIAMIQRTPQGFKIRQKLIELETAIAELPAGELERLKVEAQKERSRAMLLNAQSRVFKTVAGMVGDKKLSAIAGEVFGLKAIQEITGIDMGKYLPECAETFSATDIGKKLGISANKVGKLANQYGLKTEQYGILVMDKSRYNSKEMPNFRYYASVLPVLESVVK